MIGAGTWYFYEKLNNDTYMAFVNLGNSQMAECGYVSMSELMSLKLPLGLSIERDLHFEPLKDVIDTVKSGGHV